MSVCVCVSKTDNGEALERAANKQALARVPRVHAGQDNAALSAASRGRRDGRRRRHVHAAHNAFAKPVVVAGHVDVLVAVAPCRHTADHRPPACRQKYNIDTDGRIDVQVEKPARISIRHTLSKEQ